MGRNAINSSRWGRHPVARPGLLRPGHGPRSPLDNLPRQSRWNVLPCGVHRTHQTMGPRTRTSGVHWNSRRPRPTPNLTRGSRSHGERIRRPGMNTTPWCAPKGLREPLRRRTTGQTRWHSPTCGPHRHAPGSRPGRSPRPQPTNSRRGHRSWLAADRWRDRESPRHSPTCTRTSTHAPCSEGDRVTRCDPES